MYLIRHVRNGLGLGLLHGLDGLVDLRRLLLLLTVTHAIVAVLAVGLRNDLRKDALVHLDVVGVVHVFVIIVFLVVLGLLLGTKLESTLHRRYHRGRHTCSSLSSSSESISSSSSELTAARTTSACSTGIVTQERERDTGLCEGNLLVETVVLGSNDGVEVIDAAALLGLLELLDNGVAEVRKVEVGDGVHEALL